MLFQYQRPRPTPWIEPTDGQNGGRIQKLYETICQDEVSKINTSNPPNQYPDVNLVVTVNYNHLYRVIPMVEVKLALHNVHGGFTGSLDGKKMQGKSEGAMRTHSVRASKRAPT